VGELDRKWETVF